MNYKQLTEWIKRYANNLTLVHKFNTVCQLLTIFTKNCPQTTKPGKKCIFEKNNTC
jgi:hypothetical protein